jgi:HSP20 family protein
MTISSFDPLMTLDRMLSRMSPGFQGGSSQMAPPMDVYRRGDEFVVELDVPGVDPSSIDITVERNMLTVSGELHPKHEGVDEVLVCERPHARFRRGVYLGESLDTENIRADYENGVLRITIPVSREQQSRRITVQGGENAGALGDTQSGQSIDVGASQQQPQSAGASSQSSSEQSGQAQAQQ